MEWRCKWCGKPHEEDDPPCDNCGHGKFEKAVVRQTDLADDEEQKTSLVWVCTDCGREHPKHSPPCSRCGNTQLEKQRQHVDEAELTAPGYLDLLTPQYLAAFLFTLLVAGVFVSGVLGFADVPFLDQGGVPDVEDVPGNASTVGNVDIAIIEEAYIRALNERLTERGQQQLNRSASLDEITTYSHQQSIKSAFSGGDRVDADTVRNSLGEECRDPDIIESKQEVVVSLNRTERVRELGDRLAAAVIADEDFTLSANTNTLGVDIHYLEGQLYLLQYVCET